MGRRRSWRQNISPHNGEFGPMLKNQKEAAAIYALLTDLVSLCERMSDAAKCGDREEAAHLGRFIGQALQALRTVSGRIDQEQPQITLNNFCRTAECSLLRVLAFRRDYAMKCEFELLPVLQELRMYFYYWGCVFPDKKKIKQYRKKELRELASNRYIDKAEADGHYKYDLTITVQAYNHLEDATKQCIESLFHHLPGNLNYELILVNNGSSDGTKEFFEQYHPTKQIDMAVNYGGHLSFFRTYEGKYVLAISNDVFVLDHSIQNMIQCISSTPDAAYIVPQTPNISNLQALDIPCDCGHFSIKTVRYAQSNNRYDPARHIQRARLCNPITLYRAQDHFSSNGILLGGQLYSEDATSAFPDDAMSLLINRAGKKNILQKDAFCYHMGQLTIKEDEAKKGKDRLYQQGRLAFYREFGVDPWGTGFCFDLYLIRALTFYKKDHINIWGINSGLGDNPLQIKEYYKEYLHITDVTLYCTYQDRIAGLGMAGVADIHTAAGTSRQLKNVFANVVFDYIILEDRFTGESDMDALIKMLRTRLSEDGCLAVRLREEEASAAKKGYPEFRLVSGTFGVWMIGGSDNYAAV